jgi:protein-disulfide isomerase-like protein with CxxC motif
VSITRKIVGEQTSKKVTGLANVRHISRIRFLEHFRAFSIRAVLAVAHLDRAVTGHVRRRSLYVAGTRWHGVADVNTLRELRRSIGLKQEEFALLLQVPLALNRRTGCRRHLCR